MVRRTNNMYGITEYASITLVYYQRYGNSVIVADRIVGIHGWASFERLLLEIQKDGGSSSFDATASPD